MNERLKYLYDVYQRNLASEKEVAELLDLLHSETTDNVDLLHQEYIEQSEKEEAFFSSSTSEKILSNIFSHSSKPSRLEPGKTRPLYPFKKYLVAAILLMAFGLGLVFILINKISGSESNKVETALKEQKILPGGNKAILRLADGSVIVLDSAKNGLLREQHNTIITKTAQGQLVFQVKNTSADQNPNLLNTIETPKGGQYQVILPDQTIVWLNAASSIEFPSAFSGKFRTVKITGEVYFEVAKNASMPFIVESRNAKIEVLGTHFNIKDYDDEDVAKTTLLEGSVKIINQQKAEILSPGQQALYGDRVSMRLQFVQDPEKEIAWKNGFFVFKDTSIDVVMREVSRWYDVKVIYTGSVPDNEFTGKISRNVDLGQFLKILSYAGFDFKIEGKNLIVVN